MTRITDLIGIKYPIFQGGMAWVADWHIAQRQAVLASSVSAALTRTGSATRSRSAGKQQTSRLA